MLKLERPIINVKVFEYVNIGNSNIRICIEYLFLNTSCAKKVNILNTCFRYFKYLF